MKLFDIPPGSKILLPITKDDKELGMQLCTFDHLDGAYSHITTPDGAVVHLSASAPLVAGDGHYELKNKLGVHKDG